LISELAIAKSALNPVGTVFIHGENWNAISDGGKIEEGDEVKVTKVEGLKLRVKKT